MNIPQLLQLLAMGQNVSAQLPCVQGCSKENTDSCRKKKDPPFTEEENQVLIHLYRDNYLEAQEKGLQFNSDCWEAIKVAFNEEMKEKRKTTKKEQLRSSNLDGTTCRLSTKKPKMITAKVEIAPRLVHSIKIWTSF